MPVLGSDLVEVKKVIEENDIGMVVETVEPKVIAQAISDMLKSPKMAVWKQNCEKAANTLNWEKESEVLAEILDRING